jgi:hypothetical protein
MSLALQVVATGTRGKQRFVRYKATPSNAVNYPPGGDAVDFTQATNPLNLPMAFLSVPPAQDQVRFLDSLAGNDPEYVVGALLTNGKVKLWASAGNDHVAGVYTAAELADTLIMEVEVPVGK